jgi:hypothetical protein
MGKIASNGIGNPGIESMRLKFVAIGHNLEQQTTADRQQRCVLDDERMFLCIQTITNIWDGKSLQRVSEFEQH